MGTKRLVYHVENPARQSWASVLAPLSKSLGLRRIAFADWLERVKRLDGDSTTLYEFLEHDFRHVGGGRLYLDTAAAKRGSETLGAIESVCEEVVERYAVRCVAC